MRVRETVSAELSLTGFAFRPLQRYNRPASLPASPAAKSTPPRFRQYGRDHTEDHCYPPRCDTLSAAAGSPSRCSPSRLALTPDGAASSRLSVSRRRRKQRLLSAQVNEAAAERKGTQRDPASPISQRQASCDSSTASDTDAMASSAQKGEMDTMDSACAASSAVHPGCDSAEPGALAPYAGAEVVDGDHGSALDSSRRGSNDKQTPQKPRRKQWLPQSPTSPSLSCRVPSCPDTARRGEGHTLLT